MNSLDLGTKAKSYARGTTGTEPGTPTPGSWVGRSARGVCTLVTRLCRSTHLEALRMSAGACYPSADRAGGNPPKFLRGRSDALIDVITRALCWLRPRA